MKYNIPILLGLLFFGFYGKAQKGKFSGIVSIEAGKPTGLFHYTYHFSGGAHAGAKYILTEKIAFTATAGYYKFFMPNGGEGLSYIPVLGGVEYHFIPKAFVAAEGGGAWATYSRGLVLACAVPAVGYYLTDHLSAAMNYTGLAQYGLFVGGMNLRLTYSFYKRMDEK